MRALVGLVASCILLATQSIGAADPYPSRPIKVICVYPAGGGLDIVMRSIGQKLAQAWGHPVIIENLAGAGTTLGAATTARAPPDGYTILATDISYSIAASFYKKLPYDPAKDLIPISMIATASHAIVVNPNFRVASLSELIEYAIANPGKALYATPGPGTVDHLAWAQINKLAGGGIVAVPYKGSAASLVDVVAGRVQIYSGATGTLVNYVKSNQLRPLAVFENERAEVLPDVPTISEIGHPDLLMNAWYGLFAPAGTPREIVDEINTEVTKALKTKEVLDTLALLGNAPIFGVGPDQFAKLLKQDFEKWRKVVALADHQ